MLLHHSLIQVLSQIIHPLREDCLIVERAAAEQRILCIANFTPEKIIFRELDRIESMNGFDSFHEIISGKTVRPRKRGIPLGPYQCAWLVPKG